MNDDLLSNKEQVLALIRERLGATLAGYARRLKEISSRNSSRWLWKPAGVLVPLCFKKRSGTAGAPAMEFHIQLIRRSSAVAQGGDLSCPGGMLDRPLDGLIRLAVMLGLIPAFGGAARKRIRERGPEECAAVGMFLANALREAWEEIGLSPWNVEFLGALPSQDLYLFTRTIFPVVGLVRKEFALRPNYEVDGMVEIPLSAFFREDQYGTYCIDDGAEGLPSRYEMPCLVWQGPDGSEDVLWGATFQIIMNFLAIVFGFSPRGLGRDRLISRTLSPEYLHGKEG